MPHQILSFLHWTTSLHNTTSHPLPLCPPPSLAGPHSFPALLHTPPFLSASRLISCTQGLLCWTSYFRFMRCIAGRSTGRVGSFFPLTSVFCFSFPPAHCMLNVFGCPTFVEDGLECNNKSCCVSIECPHSFMYSLCLGWKGNPIQKPRLTHIQMFKMFWVHFYPLFKFFFLFVRKCRWKEPGRCAQTGPDYL